MKAGRWGKKNLRGAELRGKTLGVVGLGRIGREVVRRALAFDMVVIAHDPFIASQMADDLGIELVVLEALAERSDFITLHLPSTDSTRGLLNRALLARCRPGARIINTCAGRPGGRGGPGRRDLRGAHRRRRTRRLPAGASRRHRP